MAFDLQIWGEDPSVSSLVDTFEPLGSVHPPPPASGCGRSLGVRANRMHTALPQKAGGGWARPRSLSVATPQVRADMAVAPQ